jgi:hypothetical protein
MPQIDRAFGPNEPRVTFSGSELTLLLASEHLDFYQVALWALIWRYREPQVRPLGSRSADGGAGHGMIETS